ncbi:MAG TPA: transcriptional repressor [Candidatus Saccharimonadales bacterium]|nr:transcriptional repressor [Candidatus Saccharimonadales bacterium]
MDHAKQFETTLKKHHERLSSARWAIFKTLTRKAPIAIPAFVAEMQKIAIDPATTYRNIKLFRELNILRDIGTGNRRMIELSDAFDAHHHHFWCRACHAFIDFDSHEVETSLRTVATQLGVEITSHHLELSGLCQDCRVL